MATIRQPFITYWAAPLVAVAFSFGLINSGKAADKESLTSLACASAPDLVLTNGKILTVDKNDSIASTVRIRGDRIITVGEEVGPTDTCTEIIDLGGSTVIPGFIDAHVHYLRSFVRIGHMLAGIRTLRSISDLQDAIERFAATIPVAEGPTISDDFIVALRGWSPSGFAENRLPSLDELDQAAPNHPVAMMQFGGPGVTNSMGKAYFEENGISVADDGSIARGPGPAFLGRQPAYDALAKTQTLDHKKRSLRERMERSTSIGLLTIVDGGGTDTGMRSFNEYEDYEAALTLWREGLLNVRIRVQYKTAVRDADGLSAVQARVDNAAMGLGDDMFKVAGFAENMVARTAPTELFEEAIMIAAKAGWVVQQHSVDAAEIEQHTTAFERVNAKIPIADLHWSLSHVEEIDDEILSRLKAIGAGVAVAPHWYSGSFPMGKVGPRFRLILDSGINVGASSDGGMAPFTWIYFMTTGKTRDGDPILEEQKITRMEALRISTIGGAWIVREENELGSIEPGKLADLVVLSDDYLSVPDEELRSLKSVLSVLGGDIVYSDGSIVQCVADQSNPWHRQNRNDRCAATRTLP